MSIRQFKPRGGFLFAAAFLVTSGTSSVSLRAQSTGPVRAQVDALIEEMTPEEKAAQITTVFALPAMKGLVENSAASGGGSFLFVADPKETNRLQRLAMERSRLKIPILFGFDVVHGLSTIFPVPIGIAASWDPDLAERTQAVAAAEARAVGIHWTFAPMIDVTRDARWGRIVEGTGEDPFLGSVLAAAQVRGFQGPQLGTPGRLIAGPKHFVGYGAALGGRDYDEVDLSESQLFNVYLPPFKAAIDAGAGNVMSAYMALNGVPATGNRWLLQDVLRGELDFTGWVVSDADSVNNLKTHGLAADPQQAAAAALNAGTDMEMALYMPAYANLPKALAAGDVSRERLDEAVRRILEAKIRMGLFDNPYIDVERAAEVLRSPAHLELARVAAERSAVLLKNSGELLPLDRSKLRSVAIIGPLANAARDTLGPWVFNQNQPALQSILDGIQAKLGSGVKVNYSAGVRLPKRANPSPFAAVVGEVERPEPLDDFAGISEAVHAAQGSDVAILVLGEAQDMIGEAASRSSLDLPGRQHDLLDAVVATGKPTVVLLINGRPLDLKDTKAEAILELWYPGSRGGDAAANLLFGDAVPGGKLPFTWVKNVGHAPAVYSHLPSHDPKNATRRYWNEANAPAFIFGHGLSYSRFTYSNLTVTPARAAPGANVTVSFDLKNAGSRTADEVAQLYLHQKTGSASRPVRELKGFRRVSLEPGESRKITFTLGPNELRYWSSAARDWTLEESKFDVWVGGSSAADLAAGFEVRKQ